MKKVIACMLVGCMVLFCATALAQQVTDADLTLDFHFGIRTGRYTGEVVNGLPNGKGSFISMNEDQEEWTYTGEWVDGHFEGQGATVWHNTDWREEGRYSSDYLNGEGTKFLGDIVQQQGVFTNGELVHGRVFDELGNLYFEGDFEDGLRVESPEAQANRLVLFFGEALEYDYGAVWKDYDRHIGKKVVFAGRVSYVWAHDDEPGFQEFALDVNNNSNEWIDVFGYMAKGESKVVVGDEDVMVFGVLMDKYRWEDNSGNHSAPLVQLIGIERLDFPCEPLSVGSKGKTVKALQTRLLELGYYSGSIDGDYGKGTKQSVIQYQEAIGLPASGVASLKTLYELFTKPTRTETEGAHDVPPDQKQSETGDFPMGDTVSATVERPSPADFLWYTEDVFHNGIPAQAQTIDRLKSIIGGWKALILYDPDNAHHSSATEYLNVHIQADKEHVSLTMDWYLIAWLGDGEFFDESDMEDSVFLGEWMDGGFWASGAGTVRLTAFYTQGDVQYAIGTMDTPDGIPAYIALVRP